MMRCRSRILALVLLAGLGTTAAACGKSGPGTVDPAGGAAKAGGITLRYGQAASKLKQVTSYEIKISGGGQYGEAKAQLTGLLDVQPAADKLKVHWKVAEVASLELKGMLKPKQEEGKPAPKDPKEVLLAKGAGDFVVDLRGETDKEATKALPENEARRKEAEERRKAREERAKAKQAEEAAAKEAAAKGGKGAAKADKGGKPAKGDKDARANAAADPPATPPAEGAGDPGAEEEDGGGMLASFFEGVFQLPTLPEAALEVGKEVKVQEEDTVPLGGDGGPKLPIDSESVFRLVKIDETGGRRLAEVEFSIEASGATEMQGGMLVVDQTSEGSFVFDLTTNAPVRLDLTSSQTFSFGDNGQEVTTIISSEYQPG
jgi:hypothetical protein